MGDKVDYERCFAGALFGDPESVVVEAVKSGVQADWFVEGKWRLAWAAAVSLWRNGRNGGLDENLIVTEAARLASVNPDGFDGATLTLGDAADAIDAGVFACAGGYIAQLKGEMILRAMRKAVEQTFKVATKMDPELAVAELNGRLLEILSRTVVARTVSFADLVDTSVAKMEEAHRIRYDEGRDDYVPGVATPWWALTKLLNGLLPGFHVLGARTSVGKTSFALQLVRFFAEKGYHVGFDSLDMNTRSFVDRFVSEASRVSLYKANFGWADRGDMARIRDAAARIREWPVTVMVEYDVDHLFNWCRVRKSAKMLDVLFVDFVQLLSFRGSDRATDTGRMTRVSKTLKRIVNELDIPVIGLSQLNRDCERDGGREPMKADLRESGALEQDATTVWLLYHDRETREKFAREAREGSGAAMTLAAGDRNLASRIMPTFLKIDKNQNGMLGKLPFVVFSNYFTWMLGDYEAQPETRQEGAGATKRTVEVWYNAFRRVHADWRHSEFEHDLAAWGALLPEDLPPKKNERRAERAAQMAAPPPALPPLPDIPPDPPAPAPEPVQMVQPAFDMGDAPAEDLGLESDGGYDDDTDF